MANSHGLLLLCLALLVALAAATQFRVGGLAGWTMPSDPNALSYNQWAERNRFQIGDSLLFVYPPDKDSVLQVSQDSYNTCNTSSYIQRFDDGNTVFSFDRSGAFYFISGVETNCLRNESMVIVVMADRSKGAASSPSQPPSTPPSLSPSSLSLPPADASSSSSSSPSSAPPAEASPPPSGSAEASPPPGPSGEQSSPPPPPPNGAPSKVVGFMGSVGAFLGSLLFVL